MKLFIGISQVKNYCWLIFFFWNLEGINAIKYERPKYSTTHCPKI